MRNSQRERLVEAMLRLVARRGYAATSVPDVIAAARVSRNAFYAQFADKEACFLAGCERDLPDMIDTIYAAASEAGDDWTEALRLGLLAYLRWWQERPEYAQAYFVELPRAGERAAAQRDAAYRPFLDMLAALAGRARPESRPLGDAVPRLIVYGATEFIASEVRAGRATTLESSAGDLFHYTVTLLTAS
ncbi:TetR/AcrR family transcriptional regulator [Nonomuraea soli]|uniref:AcrR family transcriptional regulator n=1 Tax=Nonomuraea soli TaxID=1032476 RepID=A0A7W0CQE1_9ACTN|nr:TetR/AcrR family transcriptional regulator [Nonomuraea soli]MBA2895431.1 AcrR family transcriptional regulator [Nonomuraea soli]